MPRQSRLPREEIHIFAPKGGQQKLPKVRELSYREREAAIHLPTLRERTTRRNIITNFKRLHDFDIVGVEALFKTGRDQSARGHTRTLTKIKSEKVWRNIEERRRGRLEQGKRNSTCEEH